MKKGGAAADFLITYGWVIAIALIAMAALTYFGILKPDTYLPDVCAINKAFGCREISVLSNGSAVLVIENNGQSTLGKIDLKIGTAGGACTPNTNIAAGASAMCAAIVAQGNEGEKFADNITFSYVEQGSAITHKKIGNLAVNYGKS